MLMGNGPFKEQACCLPIYVYCSSVEEQIGYVALKKHHLLEILFVLVPFGFVDGQVVDL